METIICSLHSHFCVQDDFGWQAKCSENRKQGVRLATCRVTGCNSVMGFSPPINRGERGRYCRYCLCEKDSRLDTVHSLNCLIIHVMEVDLHWIYDLNRSRYCLIATSNGLFRWLICVFLAAAAKSKCFRRKPPALRFGTCFQPLITITTCFQPTLLSTTLSANLIPGVKSIFFRFWVLIFLFVLLWPFNL